MDEKEIEAIADKIVKRYEKGCVVSAEWPKSYRVSLQEVICIVLREELSALCGFDSRPRHHQ